MVKRAPFGADTSLVTTLAAERAVELEELVEASRERAARSLRGRDRLTTRLGALTFVAVAVALATQTQSARAVSFGVVAVCILAYALASRVEFEFGTGAAIPTQLVFVPMLFLLPANLLPAAVAAGLLLATVPDLRGRRHADQLLVQCLSSWHAVGPALVMLLASEPEPSLGRWPWPVLAGAVLAQIGFDFLSSAGRGRIALGVPVREQLRYLAPVYLVDLVLTPVGLAFAIVAADDPRGALLTVPLLGLFAFFARERQRRIDHALELTHAYRGTAFLLGDVVEADDAYTGSHSRDVVELVLGVADELNLDPKQRRDAELTALLHDVGKIRIPSEIINKPGALSAEERSIVETHTVEGERLLARVGGLLGDVGRLVRSCHERWDGAGYPDGLAGDETPLVARIVMCCDAYNAMTTDRSYRKALPVSAAVAELERGSGTQFDPAVVRALVRSVARDET
jgi:HD-GYP domain-containing protein (c-di-GMP phosphodiesterase class II)